MESISYSEFSQNSATIIDKIANDSQPLVITGRKSPVVLMAMDEFHSLQETLYLLSNPANATHLRQSIADIEAGKGVAVSLEDL